MPTETVGLKKVARLSYHDDVCVVQKFLFAAGVIIQKFLSAAGASILSDTLRAAVACNVKYVTQSNLEHYNWFVIKRLSSSKKKNEKTKKTEVDPSGSRR